MFNENYVRSADLSALDNASIKKLNNSLVPLQDSSRTHSTQIQLAFLPTDKRLLCICTLSIKNSSSSKVVEILVQGQCWAPFFGICQKFDNSIFLTP